MPKARGRERTLTAVRSPLARQDEATVPVLLFAGHARGEAPAGLTGGLRLLGDQLRIGRGEGTAEGELLLPDPRVSAEHARLVRTATGVELEDLGSKNGTFVMTGRLTGRALLTPGVPFFIGDGAFVFRMVSPRALDALQEEAAAPLGPLATLSPVLAVTAQKLRRWAVTGEEILLCGETGVGKEVYARAVHAHSGRRGEFVAVNCAALPRDLVESELFGYRPGAHSTARAGKPGLIERAEGGTLFLDEVGETPAEAQPKLLRFLQDREVTPLGGTRPRRLDVRILAATNRPTSAAEPGLLRADLLGRLGAAPVVLPPLRERREDLGAPTAHLLGGAAARGCEGAAFRALFHYAWPLNVRELEKVLGAAVALAQGTRPIGLGDLPPAFVRSATGPVPAAPPGSQAALPGVPGRRAPAAPGPSAEELVALLERHQGNVADVSRALGRQRAAVWRWIKQFGLGVAKYRDK